MATAQQILDKCKAMTPSQLREYGKQQYHEVWDVLCNYISGFEIIEATIDSLVVVAGLDGELLSGEWEFIKYVFDIHECNYDYYCDKVASFQSIKIKRTVSTFKQSLPYKVKEPFVCLCIALMCADNRFTYEDLDFLEDCLLS